MTPQEVTDFEDHPLAADMVALRLSDEEAKVKGWQVRTRMHTRLAGQHTCSRLGVHGDVSNAWVGAQWLLGGIKQGSVRIVTV